MKKGVNWIENQSENCYKMFKNCYIMHLGEQLDQLWVQVSLELNEIETTRFFFCRKRGQSVRPRWITKRAHNWIKNLKKVNYHHRSSIPCTSMGVPTPQLHHTCNNSKTIIKVLCNFSRCHSTLSIPWLISKVCWCYSGVYLPVLTVCRVAPSPLLELSSVFNNINNYTFLFYFFQFLFFWREFFLSFLALL